MKTIAAMISSSCPIVRIAETAPSAPAENCWITDPNEISVNRTERAPRTVSTIRAQFRPARILNTKSR